MNGTVTMELLSETVERLPLAELAFYPVAFVVLLLSWTTRAATSDPAAVRPSFAPVLPTGLW